MTCSGTGAIHAANGRLVLDGTEPVLGPDVVTLTDGSYALGDVAMSGIADKLAIPLAYLETGKNQPHRLKTPPSLRRRCPPAIDQPPEPSITTTPDSPIGMIS